MSSDLKSYIHQRKTVDKDFAKGYEKGYREFKLGILLRQWRTEAGLTQEALAYLLDTKKSAISRMENHAEDMRLSTLFKIADLLGRKVHITFQDISS